MTDPTGRQRAVVRTPQYALLAIALLGLLDLFAGEAVPQHPLQFLLDFLLDPVDVLRRRDGAHPPRRGPIAAIDRQSGAYAV